MLLLEITRGLWGVAGHGEAQSSEAGAALAARARTKAPKFVKKTKETHKETPCTIDG